MSWCFSLLSKSLSELKAFRDCFQLYTAFWNLLLADYKSRSGGKETRLPCLQSLALTIKEQGGSTSQW